MGEDERAARTLAAQALQGRWGCTAAGQRRLAVLPADLAAAAAHHAEVTGVAPCASCPHTLVRGASAWVREVQRALRLMRETKGAIAFRASVGREPHVWDVRGMDALLVGWAAAMASDEEIRKAERETTRTPP